VSFARNGAPQTAVIPAKAGIHSANLRKFGVLRLDSRFRGNDGWLELNRFQMTPLPGSCFSLRPRAEA
jgi:hypothetical protein